MNKQTNKQGKCNRKSRKKKLLDIIPFSTTNGLIWLCLDSSLVACGLNWDSDNKIPCFESWLLLLLFLTNRGEESSETVNTAPQQQSTLPDEVYKQVSLEIWRWRADGRRLQVHVFYSFQTLPNRNVLPVLSLESPLHTQTRLHILKNKNR